MEGWRSKGGIGHGGEDVLAMVFRAGVGRGNGWDDGVAVIASVRDIDGRAGSLGRALLDVEFEGGMMSPWRSFQQNEWA